MNITIFAVSVDKANFFLRVAKGFKEEHKITFLTTRYHTYKAVLKSGYKVYMLQDFINEDTDVKKFKSYENESILMDVQIGFLSRPRAIKQFDVLAKGFKNYFELQEVDKFILWNGSMLQGYIGSLIADSFNINKLFFEVGNFPNKIFIDKSGVNAKSTLINKDLTIVEDYDEARIVHFLEEYKRKKEEVHHVPQSLKSYKKLKLFLLWDIVYNIFSKYPIIEKEKKLSDYFLHFFPKKQNYIYNYDSINFRRMDYILFPLQVSTDSQIIRNSDIDLNEAINEAVLIASKKKLNLIIKPHPAEYNCNVLEKIQTIKQDNPNVFIVNENTYLLIKHSKLVVTINSTVGIESLMYYKHTVLLGRAFYKNYCENKLSSIVKQDTVNKFLYNYFFKILQNGDFFNNETIYFKEEE